MEPGILIERGSPLSSHRASDSDPPGSTGTDPIRLQLRYAAEVLVF